jgi:broad specificity phosphatase PhoE
MDRVLLARHGESELSVQGLTNGDPAVECGLTELGRRQARRLGRQVAGTPLDLYVVSEFQRARETAELALADRPLPRLVLPCLNDIRFGAFEGKLLADYRAWARAHGPEEAAPGGGDSRAATVARYAAAFRTILSRSERAVLVVAHSLPIRYVLDAAAGKTPGPVVEQVPYAEAFALEAAQLTEAAELLEGWAREPTWPT